MFYYISGKLAHLEAGVAVIDAGGVGYRLTISGTTYDAMPPNRSVKEPPVVKLYTHMAVREDGIELFGFANETELSSFKLLISVSGVGPKAAMSILSLLTPEKFALAVCTDDKKTIAKANGIGPKTAARIILELKDKLMKEHAGEDLQAISEADTQVAGRGGKRGVLSEATDALLVLGYSRAEALNALKDLNTDTGELEEVIRLALKKLMKF
ncbi:MAG: Holliday junction branch migration protein RuvA [Ruminococcaceae bacterium]|nr:Holliday junction branch migration protein RuvA [Oscillospiraceae bacterium]